MKHSVLATVDTPMNYADMNNPDMFGANRGFNRETWKDLDSFIYRLCDRDSQNHEIATLLLEMTPLSVERAEKQMVDVKFCVRENLRGREYLPAEVPERLIMAVWFAYLFSRAVPWSGVRLVPGESMLYPFDVFVDTKSVRGEMATVNIREFIYEYSGRTLRSLTRMTDDVMGGIKKVTREVFVRQYALEMAARTKMEPSIIRVVDSSRNF